MILQLAKEAGVRYRAVHNLTTIDPPEVVYHVRAHEDVVIDRPPRSFFAEAVRVGKFPTRTVRWCCTYLKEARNVRGATLVMGVRAQESPRRAKQWKPVTAHVRTGSFAVNPILYWQEHHVWEFIHDRGIPYCRLYDEGFSRLGCIGCPNGRKCQKEQQFRRWPRYERLWKRLFETLWNNRSDWFGDKHFSSWEEMWEWWVSDAPIPGEKDECLGFLEMLV